MSDIVYPSGVKNVFDIKKKYPKWDGSTEIRMIIFAKKEKPVNGKSSHYWCSW